MSQGYQAPSCATCRHKEGEHRSNRASLAGTLRFGPCLHEGCECRAFVDATAELEGGDSAAA